MKHFILLLFFLSCGNLSSTKKNRAYSGVVEAAEDSKPSQNATSSLSILLREPKLRRLDAVMLTTGKDTRAYEKALESALKYLVDVDQFYVITPNADSLRDKMMKAYPLSNVSGRVHYVDEKVFPFNFSSVADVMIDTVKEIGSYPLEDGKSQFERTVYSRMGWFLQQLLKFYAGKVLHLQDFVLLDSDVVWFRNTTLIASQGVINGKKVTKYYYASSRQRHQPYLATLPRIAGVPLIGGKIFRSGIVHHIVIVEDVMDSLMNDSQVLHGGIPFWQVLLNESAKEMTCRAPRAGICGSGSTLSEYELYFNYARVKAPETVELRPLFWTNGPSPGLLFWPPSDTLISDGVRSTWLSHRQQDIVGAFEMQIKADQLQGYDFVGYHSYAKRRYTELVWEDMDVLCKGVPKPHNSTCSWRGIEEAPKDKKRDPAGKHVNMKQQGSHIVHTHTHTHAYSVTHFSIIH